MKLDLYELGDIATVSAGQSAPQGYEFFCDDGTPFIRAGSLEFLTNGGSESNCEKVTDEAAKKHHLRLFPADTVLFAKSGMSATLGRVYRLKEPCYVVSHLAAILPGPKIFPYYLQRWFEKHPPSRLIPNESYPSIRLSEIKTLKIPLPTLLAQKRIATILDKADAIRRKRRRAIQLADEFSRSVFLDIFGDLIKNTKGWTQVCFGDICESRLGKMLDSKKQTGNHKRKYLRNANLKWDYFDLTDLLEMDFNEKDRETFNLKYGDLLICEGGEVGRAAIWRNEFPECHFQKALHRVRTKPKKATPEFLLHLLWFLSRNGGFRDHATSATIAHLTGVKLKEMIIPLPPLGLQQMFSNYYFEIKSIKEKFSILIKSSLDLFASTSQRAFRGEL